MASGMGIPPNDTDAERHRSDLYTRPGWIDAVVALAQLDQGKANGDRGVLWLRGQMQKQLRSLGRFLGSHAGKFLFVSMLAIATFSVGLKSATFHTNIEQLWAEPQLEDGGPPSEILSTHQMLVQTSVEAGANVLHQHGLLEHLELIRKALQVSVQVFDVSWRLKDVCQSPTTPNFDIQYMEEIFDNMMPCLIATPLDCFWEGSKLLGPDYPARIPYNSGTEVRWTNLNPVEMIEEMKLKQRTFDYRSLEDYLKSAGITTAYQEKPCLNPKDPECPKTAPNYNSSEPVDVGAALTSGCYGFAAKYMHWPEDLIVGGAQKNKSGHIKQAKALQSVVQLMGEHELFEYYSETYKVHHIGWNHEKAAIVLNAWQKQFTEEIERLTKSNISSSSYHFDTFSTATLNRMLAEYSKNNLVKMGIVLGIASAFGWLVQSGVASLSVMVLASSSAAGLGVCSLLGIPMNLLSVHVLPFISVGLAMRDIFVMVSAQNRNLSPLEVLQCTGPSIICSALLNAATFMAAATVPVPALRAFCLQSAVLVVFQATALLVIFPALLALEQRCRKSGVPCFRPLEKPLTSINNNNDPEHSTNLLTAELICQKKKTMFTWLVNNYLVSAILNPFMKVVLCLSYAVVIVLCVFNGLKINYDVRLSTFLPKNTQEYRYLEAQSRYFGFYNFYLVTTEMEYPLNQPLLYEYHAALSRVPHVLKDSNGGLNMNDFWLANFRDYLVDLQEEFDENLENHCITSDKWHNNASEKAVLAFKLLSQTGIVEFPVDRTQVLNRKLVREGIIDPKGFYNFLSVWNCNDQMSYSSSQANLMPKPFQYFSSRSEFDLKIPKSQPLVYTQMPFYLKNLKSTGKIVETLKQIRDISDEYNSRGLKNYPVGLIFAYFNHFLDLHKVLGAQFLITVMAFVMVSCVFVHWTKIWCGVFSVLTLMTFLFLTSVNALSGTMGAIHFLLLGRNVLLILTGYLSAIGNRERRLRMSLELNADPILKGDLGLLVCCVILATSDFEFIQRHIFMALLISIGSATANSLIFFPILLSLVGPKSELQPSEHSDRISTPPPPPPTPTPPRAPPYTKHARRNPAKATREPSLTTITEESCNQSIVVEPQVTVEYSSPESSSSGPYTTKVTATANIKVELVAPVPVHRPKCNKCHRSKCSRRRQQCKCCKTESDGSDSSADTEPCPTS